MDQPDFYRSLIKRYKDKTATDDELEVFMQLTREGKLDVYLTEDMDDEAGIADEQTSIPRVIAGRTVMRWLPYAAAAATILVMLSIGMYYYNRAATSKKVQVSALSKDVPPGGNKATLTLADGRIIMLEDAANGDLTRQAGIVIKKTADGELVYDVSNAEAEKGRLIYNTISTPKGGEYRIILPDGSIVWLNASSSLRYPVNFIGTERRVTLTGEGYFEIAKQNGKSFIVTSHKQEVEVLGTHFNINAYIDEPTVNTTLLEGSIKVSPIDKTLHPQIIKPGEQAIINQNIKLITVDVEQAVAWKNGMFHFQDTNLKEVMRQLERWYDVEVDYNSMPDVEFVGVVPRNAKLSSVLKALELTSNIKFQIEGRRIRLMK